MTQPFSTKYGLLQGTLIDYMCRSDFPTLHCTDVQIPNTLMVHSENLLRYEFEHIFYNHSKEYINYGYSSLDSLIKDTGIETKILRKFLRI